MTNDYLKDLDDWDNESQQILLSLAKNNAFISFDEIEKGIYGKAKDSFAKIMIDKKIKRGETHRGLTNVHPFATQYRDNLDSNQIDHRYFVDASKTTYNNVSIITDVDTENQALEIIKRDFYVDNNLNGEVDAGEYVFHLIIFQSTDGNKVNEAYQASSQPNSNEIVLYLEQGQDVFSSQKMYAKVGEGIWEKVLSKDNVYKNTLWKVLNEHLKFSDKELIFELLEKGQIEGDVIISTFLKGINITLQVLSASAFAIGWLIEKIGEGLDFLKLPSTIWDVNGESYFFEKDKLLQKLTISTEKINQLQQTILEDKAYQAFLPNMIELILDGMMNKLKNIVTNYNKWVTNKVTEISEAMIKNPEMQNELLYDIALLCGIWDGIVDTFSSALLFIGQIAQSAFKAATNIDELLETIDNIFDFLTSGKVWESISSFFIKMREELSDIDLADIDLVKVGYIFGFGIVFIAGIFIPITAITKVGKVGNLGAKFSEMLTEVGKAIKTFPEAMKSKTAIQQINRMLEVFSSSEKTRSHAKEIAKEIKKWVVRNKSKYQELARYSKALLKRTAKTYAKKYPDGKLYKILKVREAYRLYGKHGKTLVQEVNVAFEKVIKLKGYKEKVMISGMLYKGDNTQKVFSAVNFTREERISGKLVKFIESMHPVLKKRYELHLKEIGRGLQATPEMIEKAGIAASHGEIRAVNDLLYYLESIGIKVTDDIFKDIMGYNRYLIKEGSQPPCVHCFYLTDGILYLKLLK